MMPEGAKEERASVREASGLQGVLRRVTESPEFRRLAAEVRGARVAVDVLGV